jgi:hypothetical protein
MNQTITMFGDEAAILNRIVRPDKKLSQSAARALMDFAFDSEDRLRMRELAKKNQGGELTKDEEIELQSYLKIGMFLDLVHAKALRSLRKR